MLFELLTGKKPHIGENNYQIAYAHVNVDVPAPSAKLSELGNPGFIPDYLDALVAACTARDPEVRIADVPHTDKPTDLGYSPCSSL